jgi:basic membrane protein A
MMDQGADVIFGCGGITGNGAIIAAADVGVYAIGVDTDQYLTVPEAAPRMLSSAMKLITPGVRTHQLPGKAPSQWQLSGGYLCSVSRSGARSFR